jgi:4-amino-4-deoxy-L-arabinose transferase-like glycosyltransferase
MGKRPSLLDPWTAVRRVPAAAWICALVACLNAASWSLITPPFQVPDEPDHFAYVKQLAETGTPPTSSGDEYSAEEILVLKALHYPELRLHPASRAISSRAEQVELQEALQLGSGFPRDGSPAAGVATSQPPLYYALESIPYTLGQGGTLLDRLELMRLLSALMAGLTGLFTFLFVREALPRAPWAWTVGGLGVALSPLFGFMSGAVNPDAMLFAVSAVLFYCIARAFRQGLTTRSAIAIGLAIAVGFLTKLNFVGLAPGAFIALGILAVRGVGGSGRGALRPPALAAAIGSVPVVAFVTGNSLSNRLAFGIVAGAIRTTHGSVLDAANYIWQLYLPRLPGTVNDFPGLQTARQIWFVGYVGRFGWLDTFFPDWVYSLVLLAAGLIAVLGARALVDARATLRGRLPELAAYALMMLGLLVLIGAASYREFPATEAPYGQARYLLPLLPLLGGALALAARGTGRRWGPTAGALIVVLFLAHDLFSQLQVVARYYG